MMQMLAVAGAAGAARRMAQALRLRDRRGSTTLEMAFVFIPFVILMIGIVETAWQFTTGSMLDAAVLRASRFGAVGLEAPVGVPNTITCREQYIPLFITNSSNNFLKRPQLNVTTTSFGSVTMGGTGTNNAGLAGQIVRYDVTYTQPFITGAWVTLIGGPTQLTHRAAIVIKNEPFENVPRACT
jgi:hypothetical protein